MYSCTSNSKASCRRRRAPSLDALIPVLYLKGIPTSDFPEALQSILGEGVRGLSPANIVRLKQIWEQE